jgi:hypothetical protein
MAFLASVVVAFGVAASARPMFARATWVLTTGERISGNINIHTNEKINVARGQFAVGTDNGQETQVRVDQVAVIEFVAGAPSNAELQTLPANGHLIAMRDGATHEGRLLDLINGELVRWLYPGDRSEDIPISLVSRVYMNTDAARRVYNYTPSAAPDRQRPGGLRPGGPTIPNGPGTAVTGNTPWTDTGVAVQRGNQVRFTASGQVRWSIEADALAGPDGSDKIKNPAFPVPNANVGMLIGRIGNGRAFPIGSLQSPIVMPDNGKLYLGINDVKFDDNAGGFRVSFQYVR